MLVMDKVRVGVRVGAGVMVYSVVYSMYGKFHIIDVVDTVMATSPARWLCGRVLDR